MKKLLFILAASGLFFTACNSSGTGTKSSEQFKELMESSAGGVFRGASFDMSKEDVSKMETARETVDIYEDESESELIVTTDMGPEVLDFADVTYSFDDQGLYSISVETYIETAEKAKTVFDEVIAFYTEKFGAPTVAEDGYSEFKAKDEKSGYDYLISVKNIDDLDDSFGMYMYFDLQ